jgi:hypothetical protein
MIPAVICLILCFQLPFSHASTFKTNPITIYRPRDPLAVQHARNSSLSFQQCNPIEWDELVVPAPDVHDKHTLSQLARMAGNAYALPDSDSWYDLEPTWNRVRCFPLQQITGLRVTLSLPEFPYRLAEPNRWLPWARFCICGQQHSRFGH